MLDELLVDPLVAATVMLVGVSKKYWHCGSQALAYVVPVQ